MSYYIYTKSSINGELTLVYPKSTIENLSFWRAVLNLSPYIEHVSPETPFLSRTDTAELAKTYMKKVDVQDVLIKDNSGDTILTIWKNGKWL